MKSWKWRILFPVIFLCLLVGGKYILWDLPMSSGKRVGNLTKISKKGKFWFTKTWEGTIDEGSGDKLTSYFSVRDEKLAEELYEYEGKSVVLYYEQHILGWPRDTNYVITSWKPKDGLSSNSAGSLTDILSEKLSLALFCSFLGSLYQKPELYKEVKEYIKENNLYLYNRYAECNK